MIETIRSKCQKHNLPIITYHISEGYCQDCLDDLSNCGQLPKAIIDNVINEFSETLFNSSVERLSDNVLLIGPKKGEQKHGHYYYFFDDGTKEYAGFFDQNNKEGIWNDFVSFNDQLDEYNNNPVVQGFKTKRKRINNQKYVEGNKISYLKVVGQQIYSENIGLYNQLEFKGNLINNVKVGYWQILYEGNVCGGGNFQDNGQKTGQWIDVYEKYHRRYQVTYSGEYKNGLRTGEWITTYESKYIGGGIYDEKGVKQGQWIDLHDNYYGYCLVTYSGEYKNGQKIGKWITAYEDQQIGGGIYDEKGVKSGQWIDLHDNYYQSCKVTYSGEYKNGLKFGKWITTYEGQQIGGGTYDEKGVKQGDWVDLHDNYWDYCKVTYTGEYKNGLKIGKWITKNEAKLVGDGIYDEKGVKTGQWMDLHDNYWLIFQVTCSGEYKNGLRIGKWIITDEAKQIGGGIYDEKGVKQDEWIDLHDNYWDYCKVTYSGEYKNGFRTGKWITTYEGQQIGGGIYDEKGVKSGRWIDLHDNYWDYFQMTQSGEYKNGLRIGDWTETRNEVITQLATYDIDGRKL